jgi:hypothetical protein
MIEAIRSSEWKNAEPNVLKKPLSQNLFYQQQKKRNSEHKKQVYRAIKQRKKNQ